MSADMGIDTAFTNTSAKTQAAQADTRSITDAEYDSIVGDSVTVAAHGNDTQKIAYARLLYTAVDTARVIVDSPAADNLEALELYFRQLCKPLLNSVTDFMPAPSATTTVAVHAATAADDEIPDVIPGSPAL